jgi:multidrug efflux system membrane fusion protein
VGGDGTVSMRPVKLSPAEADRVAVFSGLAPGARVVIAGADRLRDGAKVKASEGR